MGRRPEAHAARRADKESTGLAVPGRGGCPKPVLVTSNPRMSEIWDEMVGSGMSFEPVDAPLLQSLVFNIAVVDECRRKMLNEDGSVRALVEVETPSGDVLIKPNPYARVMKDAETMALKIAQEMGLTRFSRVRLGLTQAMGQQAVMSIAEQIDRAISDRK